MNLVVGFTCLVCVVVLGCVSGLPDPQRNNRPFGRGAFGGSSNGQFGRYKSIPGPRFRSPGYPSTGFGGSGLRRLGSVAGIGCMLNNVNYTSGARNDDTCLIMLCVNGAWVYTNTIRHDCGNCTVHGDPHFDTFDETNFLTPINNQYTFGGLGNIAITQNGLINPSFGVNAVFKTCNTDRAFNLSCVTSISYYEPGITVDVELPTQTTDTTFPFCTSSGIDPSTEPQCRFMVKVNGMTQLLTGGSVTRFQARFGNILMFNHKGIGGADDLACVNVVGSQGLSVSLCQHRKDFSWLYVHAMPTLRYGNPLRRNGQRSLLYGLCNTYTGTIQSAFTVPGGAGTRNIDIFGEQWKSMS